MKKEITGRFILNKNHTLGYNYIRRGKIHHRAIRWK
jgi:hypothetical protein